MSEEHGYQRNGKKCREKFENLYKYYKKTKEGKAGRQDGKHYRFFRQLEALYGDTNINSSASVSETHLLGNNFSFNFQNNNNNQELYPGTKLSDTSLSLSNFSDSDTTSSDDFDHSGDNNDLKKKKRKSKGGWKNKIKDFIDVQMRKLMDKQEAWMEKMMRTIEHKEQERMLREEEWRKQDAERIEREHKFWAMIWPEGEITRLIQLRSGMELKFQQSGLSEEVLWDEISTKMACFGHDRSGLMCKDKWDSVNNYLLKCNKKRKENSKSCTYYQQDYCETSERGDVVDHTIRLNVHGNSPPNSNNNNMGNNSISDSCFKYFMGDHY
ncbi:hypothetical protein ACJIZ3_024365 [Penstemon smallii]|uniref:Myb-like domain-containing protein n=1 Tax=Penstemon smallii TaxID=265156 RepID=A0ABD3TRL5_9LAMI